MKSAMSVGSAGGLLGYVGEGRLCGVSFLRGCLPLGQPETGEEKGDGDGTISLGFLSRSMLNTFLEKKREKTKASKTQIFYVYCVLCSLYT